jgi:ribose 5-phosphate isomerase A
MTGAEHALRYVEDGHVVGLGTGRAATAFVRALAARVRTGLHIVGVPTSEATARLARELGIALVSLAERPVVDVAVDGADEVDPRLDLVKGWGGALLREKIVAGAARRFVVLVGSEKLVSTLGSRGKLPVEVVPFGATVCAARLEGLGLRPALRGGDAPFVTDSGNWIYDCAVDPIGDATRLDASLRAIPGVVATGLFLGMADLVVIDADGGVETRVRQAR